MSPDTLGPLEEIARRLEEFDKRLSHLGRLTSSAWKQIGDADISVATATVDFTNIPSIYRHLRILAAIRTDVASTSTNVVLRFNGDAGLNYRTLETFIRNPAVVVTSEFLGLSALFGLTGAGATAPANWVSPNDVFIPDYKSTDAFKTLFTNCSTFEAVAVNSIRSRTRTGIWLNTAAITRITVFPITSDFDVGSRITLYGIE